MWPLVVAAHVVFWNKQERQGVLIQRLIMYSVVLQCGGQTSRSRFNVDKRVVAKSVLVVCEEQPRLMLNVIADAALLCHTCDIRFIQRGFSS